jgi:hypothetical protein
MQPVKPYGLLTCRYQPPTRASAAPCPCLRHLCHRFAHCGWRANTAQTSFSPWSPDYRYCCSDWGSRPAFAVGDRVGVPWLGHTCNHCRYCLSARENLCDYAQFTGYQIDGGYAEYTVADERFCFLIPEGTLI